MRLLTYRGLDLSRVRAQFDKLRAAIERDDFKSADVKKLAPGNYWRAKLNDADRVLLQFARHGDETVCLALELIAHHAYDKSRFLRGAVVDDSKIEDAAPLAATVAAEAMPVRYLHPQRGDFELLDKVVSFDEAQEAVFRLPAPLIVVGSAGSGKTALALARLRQCGGRVLYVTQSPYLARNARELYFAHGWTSDSQEPEFLAYREFLETLRVPAGREVGFVAFRGWFERHRHSFGFADAHQLFEEFRGVLASQASGPLTHDDYLALGVRQSLFDAEQRAPVYELFGKYRAWLGASGLYDTNLVAFEWLALAQPAYDFAVIDEMQDLTAVQLSLILRTLARKGQFLLAGDSNQIVHPNFFSWAAVKSLFWRDPQVAQRQTVHVLQMNFRNTQAVTHAANTLLKIKHARFGSIDRESNFLVRAAAAEAGSVRLLPDKEAIKRELNARTRASAQFAVIVLRDEDKAGAKAFFQTPLVFSIHEAKGLEYPHVIVFNLVSGQRRVYAEICEGIAPADLAVDSLEYSRARDKSDKSLQRYQFYVNALYVALTRAIESVHLIESDPGHPLLALLGLSATAGETIEVAAVASRREDWEREAHRLEQQGRHEQAEAIRHSVLRSAAVPWPVWNEAALEDMVTRALDPKQVQSKPRQALYEYALWHGQQAWLRRLAREVRHDAARHLLDDIPGFGMEGVSAHAAAAQSAIVRKHLAAFQAKNVKDVLRACDQYGVDHRTVVNATPLMMAAQAGNVALVEALLARGADSAAADQYGHTAFACALARACADPDYARGPFGALFELLATDTLDVEADGRLVRLYPQQGEYLLLWLMLVNFKTLRSQIGVPRGHTWRRQRGFNAEFLMRNVDAFPHHVLRESRRKRGYFNQVLARAELDSAYQPARRLWRRVQTGYYLPNPAMRLRVAAGEGQTVWRSLAEHLNVALIDRGTADTSEFKVPALSAMLGIGSGENLREDPS